jgi:glycerophosphoryl diester phosphodiesterase
VKNTIPGVLAQHPAREIFRGRTCTSPLVVAHRGASHLHRENTLDAFAAARALGADGVELDVHLTADGAVVVHHDAVLADGRPIAQLSRSDLPSAVPALSDAFATCAPLGVNVEIKPRGPVVVERVVEAVDVIDARDRTLASSFTFEVAARASDLGLLSSLLVHATTIGDALARRCVDAGVVGLHPDAASVDPDAVACCHAQGLFVMVWTVDDPAEMRRLAAAGVDAICTNVPDVARAVLGGQ